MEPSLMFFNALIGMHNLGSKLKARDKVNVITTSPTNCNGFILTCQDSLSHR